jgi:phosphatidylserine/phosphatidylglycerophosphate/cardiolipin synthase-like enzyme
MSQLPDTLLAEISRLAGQVPASTIARLGGAIRKLPPEANESEIRAAVSHLLLADNRELATNLGATWRAQAPGVSGVEVAAALEGASFHDRHLRADTSVELVWTGPPISGGGLRNTEQVLFDLVRTANESLLITAFAAYRVDSLARELEAALKRGVSVTLIVEDAEVSEGKVRFNPLAALIGNREIACRAYHWPLEQRPRNDDGRHGSLHAKCVLADQERLFVSSANLTEFAMSLNVEIGLLISGGLVPRQAADAFSKLIHSGVLREIARY